MSSAINKYTLEYIQNNFDTPTNNGDWIINPELPNCDNKYWKINDSQDAVIEMTDEEKKTIDNIALEAVLNQDNDVFLHVKNNEIEFYNLISKTTKEGGKWIKPTGNIDFVINSFSELAKDITEPATPIGQTEPVAPIEQTEPMEPIEQEA